MDENAGSPDGRDYAVVLRYATEEDRKNRNAPVGYEVARMPIKADYPRLTADMFVTEEEGHERGPRLLQEAIQESTPEAKEAAELKRAYEEELDDLVDTRKRQTNYLYAQIDKAEEDYQTAKKALKKKYGITE